MKNKSGFLARIIVIQKIERRFVMGWIFCFIYSIGYVVGGKLECLIASVVFGLAGSIGEIASAIRHQKDRVDICE